MRLTEESLIKLRNYIEKENYSGYDLYDGLNITNNTFVINNYYLNTFITQFFKLNPINTRKFLAMKKTMMPKAIGIFLNAYTNLLSIHSDDEFVKARIDKLVDFLNGSSVKGYSGNCWNFGFNYKFMFDKPTVVITSIIAKGLFNYFQLTKDKQTKDMLIGVKEFIIKDLIISKQNEGICFSYTPIKEELCFNASMLAAETLSRIYYIEKDQELLSYIKKSVEFVLAHQKDDGRWNYSKNLNTGVEREQVDFHQGYVLESLDEIRRLTDLKIPGLEDSIRKGAEFYRREQFFENGRSKWRLPKIWPVDIHNQAQGIITFSKLSYLNPEYSDFAKKIAKWTIDNMQDKKGYFYFRKGRFITNKISYMRWSNAWMFLALTEILILPKKQL